MKIGISEFKAKSLKLLDDIHNSGESITITKRGKPFAKVIPISDQTKEINIKGTLIDQDEDIFSIGKAWETD